MIQLNYRDSRPIYEQIEDSLKKLIISGVLKGDEKLPSVRNLAMELSINPNTIQRSFADLERDGYLYSVPGKGSFVCDNTDKIKEHIDELKKELAKNVQDLLELGVSSEEIVALVREVEK